MFYKINQAGSNNDKKRSKYKCKHQFTEPGFKNIGDNSRCFCISCEPEQAEKAHQSQYSQYSEIQTNNYMYIKRQNGDQIYQGGRRYHILQPPMDTVFIFWIMVAAPYPENIFNRENDN